MLRIRQNFLLLILGLMTSFSLHAATINELFNQPNNPVAGNPHGKVTIVEFFDYQCSHCTTMAPVIANIIKKNPDVRIVFRDLPIRGPMSEYATRAALAANMQGKYYELNHALLSTKEALTEQTVLDIAKEQGLDINKLKKDMDSPTIAKQIKDNMNLAVSLKIPGTPAFFISKSNAKSLNDGSIVLGEMSQIELEDAINNAANKKIVPR